MHRIYLVTNQANNKVYVGETKRTLHKRMLAHLASARAGSDWRIHQAMRKYVPVFGDDIFKIELIEEGDWTKEQIDSLEIYWVAFYDATNYEKGYNMNPGGDSRSEESIEKARLKITGKNNPNFGKHHSEELRKKMSEARKGKNIGHVVTQETRAKIRAAQLAVVRTPEQIERLKGLRRGTTNTAESNAARSAKMKLYVGEKNSMYGKKASDETKAKMSAAQKAIGNKPPSFLGKHLDEAAKEKIRVKAQQRWASKTDEQRASKIEHCRQMTAARHEKAVRRREEAMRNSELLLQGNMTTTAVVSEGRIATCGYS